MNNLRQNRKLQNQCGLCREITPEKKIIFYLLIKRFKIELAKFRNYSQHNKTLIGECHPFSLLLRVVYDLDLISFKRECQHPKFYKYLLQKINCEKETFGRICQKIATDIAQKNYHLQVLTLQIKNIAETVGTKNIHHPDHKDSKKEYQTNKEEALMEERQKIEENYEHVNKNQQNIISSNKENELIMTNVDLPVMSYLPISGTQVNLTSGQLTTSMPIFYPLSYYIFPSQ